MTTFLRVLEASVAEKPSELLKAVIAHRNTGKTTERTHFAVFERDPRSFTDVPGSPLAYWVSEKVRLLFRSLSPFATGERTAGVGVQTNDDFRFVRLWWEISPSRSWPPVARGGRHGSMYGDIVTVLNWYNAGYELKASIAQRYGSASRHIQKENLYFVPGLTWPLRGARLQATALPAGCIFSMAGKAAFGATAELPALLALFNSRVFDYLLCVRAGKVGGVQYESGLIQGVPTPTIGAPYDAVLANLACRAWSLKRRLDSTNETSHAFLLPSGLNERVTGLDRVAIERELAKIQHEIDNHVFELYGIDPEDRAAIEVPSVGGGLLETDEGAYVNEGDEVDGEASDGDEPDATLGVPAFPMLSWLVGAAFGRFDPRIASLGSNAWPIPPEPGPFDPLPSRSPGMWLEREEPAYMATDIMVDDPGHNDDIRSRVASVAAKTGWYEPEDVRQWLAHQFFPLHIKMYSKSRRKAPIYWQLTTPSATYSVWLYIHAFTNDTLFRVQNDYVTPKLAHEERRLESLDRELRENATAAERKALAAQEALVEELRVFLAEVKRVAPLWKPNLDDGVIINFAPLWRLVPQHKPWQKEVKSTWDALCDGKYDWAHLAMHLWPERVVPKCAVDRSLAIAHDLEEVFWEQDADGKWTARKIPTRTVEDLVHERTSPAVKAALKSLLEAPTAAGGRGRGGRRHAAGADEGGRR